LGESPAANISRVGWRREGMSGLNG
jgi:hypothetical protein